MERRGLDNSRRSPEGQRFHRLVMEHPKIVLKIVVIEEQRGGHAVSSALTLFFALANATDFLQIIFNEGQAGNEYA